MFNRWVSAFFTGVVMLLFSAYGYGNSVALALPYATEHLHPWYPADHSRYAVFLTTRPLIMLGKDWTWQCGLCKVLPTRENGLITELKNQKGHPYLRVTFELREDAQWADGTPLTGADFLFSWHLARDIGNDLFDAIANLTLDPKNPKRFYVHFSQTTFFLSRIQTLLPIPKHIEEKVWFTAGAEYLSQTAYKTDPLNPGLYLGPFLPKSKATKTDMLLARVPATGKTSVPAQTDAIDEIKLLFFNSQSELFTKALTLPGTLIPEFLYQSVGHRDLIAGRKNQFQEIFGDSLVYEHLDFNLRHPILRDKSVRQALTYGTKRDDFYLYLGDQVTPAVSFTHPRDPTFSAAIAFYEYDPAKAKKLLTEAGWELQADGKRYKNSVPLQFNLLTTEEWQRPHLAAQLKRQWQEIGVQLNVATATPEEFAEIVGRVGFDGITLYSWELAADGILNGLFGSDHIPSIKNEYIGQNLTRWYSNKVDQILKKIDVTFDPERRKKLKEDLQKHYTTDLPSIPLYFRLRLALVPTAMQGFAIPGHQYPSSLFADDWRLTAALN